ncbi:M15 family metallopeptidase [Mariniflexile gromovii]|uniref:D-alanyl-D-alanine dipeptidase n=1 Tax=Mariniflexile gromovii TaxID=362523 RepID=A0ABS4BYL2_9FLAO|nr:M15 family metallopeptidase [Mariniflexile gromovii]MBP0905127.1 M15 family metallopeptidase [Mariniflexile gromovii]
MKYYITFLFAFFCFGMFAQLPQGFVYVKTIIPDLKVDLKYNTENNFVGKRVDGYQSNKLILTKESALALKKVQKALLDKNLCLKVYDGYRPQRAVNHFMAWAKDLNDTINKANYYPDVDKLNLFAEDYIAKRSGHSKGSTVDVTIIDGNTGEPLDMGSAYDFFGKASWTDYNNITDTQKANRKLLLEVMTKHGFVNFYKEWWHYTLKNEPFPNTYFDFPVK